MTKVTVKPLPHAVGTADIKSPEVARITMLLTENIKSLHTQLTQVQKAVAELQRR